MEEKSPEILEIPLEKLLRMRMHAEGFKSSYKSAENHALWVKIAMIAYVLYLLWGGKPIPVDEILQHAQNPEQFAAVLKSWAGSNDYAKAILSLGCLAYLYKNYEKFVSSRTELKKQAMKNQT